MDRLHDVEMDEAHSRGFLSRVGTLGPMSAASVRSRKDENMDKILPLSGGLMCMFALDQTGQRNFFFAQKTISISGLSLYVLIPRN